MEFLKLFLLFWFFSIVGWLMEVIVCSLYDKRIVNRGFLLGPYCPIYGFGALIMLFLSPYKDSPFVCFILALVLCSILEYFTSYLMEKLFKIRWWDYTNDAFNINGRICLKNAIAFGALGLIFTRYLNPLFMYYVNKLSTITIIIISVIIFFATVIDIVVSFKAMNSVKNFISKNLSKLSNKDATEEIKGIIHKKISSISFLERRLVNTYHLSELKNKFNHLSNNSYGIICIFITIGLVIGLVLGLVFKLGDIKIITPFVLSISILISFMFLKVKKK